MWSILRDAREITLNGFLENGNLSATNRLLLDDRLKV